MALAAGLYLVELVVGTVREGWMSELILGPERIIHAAAIAIAASILVALRRRRFGARALRVFDALGLYVALGAGLAIYVFIYHYGPHSIAGILSLFVIGRAVIVPCDGWSTLLISAPAPLGVLAVHLAHGRGYGMEEVLYPPDQFMAYVVWNQAVLWGAAALAAVAAHVNHGLRVQARKARRLGQYKLEERIGAGGMGEVYRASHAHLRRPTAIKLLHPEITDGEMLARFEREVQETSGLSHPNTISIYDYGHTPDGVFYYAMEYLDGMDLREVVQERGPFAPDRVVDVLKQACRGLREAHDKGLIHRDLKAGNLMLCRAGGEDDVVKIVDFGLVKDLKDADSDLTQMGTICGTPETLAPELIAGQPASPRSDIYALGCVGYYLLTGVPVWEVNTPLEFISHHTATPPPPIRDRVPNAPGDLEAVILRCLAKDPADRFQTVAALHDALAEAVPVK